MAISGLPVDDYSTENGILANKGQRWPLAVDPQAQANKWIRAWRRRAASRRQGQRPHHPAHARELDPARLAGAARGRWRELDPALEPVLQKQVYKQGGGCSSASATRTSTTRTPSILPDNQAAARTVRVPDSNPRPLPPCMSFSVWGAFIRSSQTCRRFASRSPSSTSP